MRSLERMLRGYKKLPLLKAKIVDPLIKGGNHSQSPFTRPARQLLSKPKGNANNDNRNIKDGELPSAKHEPIRQSSSKSKGGNNDDEGNKADEPPPRRWWHWRGLRDYAFVLVAWSCITIACASIDLCLPMAIPMSYIYAIAFVEAILLFIFPTFWHKLWVELSNKNPQGNSQNKTDNTTNYRRIQNLFYIGRAKQSTQSAKYQRYSTKNAKYICNCIKEFFHRGRP
jgi:hypothetical protein